MNKSKKKSNVVNTSEDSELDELKAQIQDLQMEVDILKGILDVVKKDPGTDWKTLKTERRQ